MPAAVNQLVRTQDLAIVLQTQCDIVELYRNDIARYAPNKPHAKSIFNDMPSEIVGSNKRFTLRDLAPGARMERYVAACTRFCALHAGGDVWGPLPPRSVAPCVQLRIQCADGDI